MYFQVSDAAPVIEYPPSEGQSSEYNLYKSMFVS